MTNIWQRDVAKFMMEVKGLELPMHPEYPKYPVIELCKALMTEELGELSSSMDDDNLVGVADGLVDLIYVTLYTANAYGLNLDPIWQEVQRSNMAKKGGPKREDGKQLKPEGWIPPDIKRLVEEQMR